MVDTDTYTLLENDSEKIRQNIGMYAGSVENPTQLAIEVIDNLLDEVAAKRANIGKIYFDDPNKAIWVIDNGKGIHVYEKQLSDGKTIDSVVMLCTKLHSGSKFSNDEYDTHIGMHGVGLVVVNALSDWLVIKTRDRNNKNVAYEYTFKDFELVSKNTISYNDDDNWSTVVGFSPSTKYFESIDIDKTDIVEKLILCQAKYEHAKFTINDRQLPRRTFIELVRQQLNLKNDDILYELKHNMISPKGKPLNICCYIGYKYNQDSVAVGDVNLRPATGKYIDHFKGLLFEKINEKVDKKFNGVDTKLYNLGLRLYISLTVPRAEFDSQTKNRMTLNVKNELITPLTSQVEWFLAQKDIITTIQANIEMKLKRDLVTIKKHSKLSRISAKNKLKDCKNKPGDVLYLVEGDSAGGTVNQFRNKETEALFPLRGKVLNVESASLEKLNKNAEVKQLIEALGPKGQRRYKKVKILADADADGMHIAVLLLLLLYKIAPDLFEENRVSVIIPPLYGATKGQQYIPIYNDTDRDTYKMQNFTISRFKGLGEMSPAKLATAIHTNMEWVVQLPKNDGQRKTLFSIITNTELKRSLMLDDRCCFETVLKHVLENKNL